MPSTVERFAAMSIAIGDDTVGKITQFGASTSVSEEMISGSEDTTTEDNAILEQYVPVSVGKTANISGVCIVGDDGQAAVETAADNATEGVVLKYRRGDTPAAGTDYTGFFTNFEKTGELTANVFRFTAQFRVNGKTPVTA